MKNSKQIELESKIIEAKYETLRITTIEMFVLIKEKSKNE